MGLGMILSEEGEWDSGGVSLRGVEEKVTGYFW